jgi:anti-sigma factor RsiW
VENDREQLEFLMSQAIDGQLSAEEAARLDRLLAGDPEAKAEFERMKQLNDLLSRWGRPTAPVDEGAVERRLKERIHDDVEFAISRMLDGDGQAVEELAAHGQRDPNTGLLEHNYRRVEFLLRGWGSLEPPVDQARFQQRLCEMIHAEAAVGRRRSVVRRIIRLYVPLAAAASVLFALGLWRFTNVAPPKIKEPAHIEVAVVGPRSSSVRVKPVLRFSFGLSSTAPIQAAAGAAGGGGAVLSFGGPQAPGAATPSGAEEMIF